MKHLNTIFPPLQGFIFSFIFIQSFHNWVSFCDFYFVELRYIFQGLLFLNPVSHVKHFSFHVHIFKWGGVFSVGWVRSV